MKTLLKLMKELGLKSGLMVRWDDSITEAQGAQLAWEDKQLARDAGEPKINIIRREK